MNCFDKIFLINLRSRLDRLSFMKYKLNQSEIDNYQIVEAVNGYCHKEIIDLFNQKYKNVDYYYGIISSPGAIGLLYTWKKLLQECLNKNYQRILIFEDDIYFHKEFHKRLKQYTFQGPNVILLGGNQLRWDDKQLQDISSKDHYEFSTNKWHCTYGTYAISLDKKAIRAIYDKIKNPLHDRSMTIDVEINQLIRDGVLSGRVFYPNLVIPEMRDSDNMGVRNMKDVALQRKWKLDLYNCLHIYDRVFEMRRLRINPRQNKNLTIDQLDNKTLQIIFDGKQLPLCVIIPSYNNEKWVEENLMSVIKQKYYNWRIIYVDDLSTDDTVKVANGLFYKHEVNGNCQLIRNSKRHYQTYNRYVAYMSCGKEEICVCLDGDDWLAHHNVFQIINEEYTKHNLLVSYGQFAYYENNRISFISGKYEFPKEVVQARSYRQYKWISQHLRTFQASIIQKIPKRLLQDENEKWLTRCSDMAEMFWVLEHSDGRHRNLGSLVYIYNKDNSLRHPNSYYNENAKSREKLIKHIRDNGNALLDTTNGFIQKIIDNTNRTASILLSHRQLQKSQPIQLNIKNKKKTTKKRSAPVPLIPIAPLNLMKTMTDTYRNYYYQVEFLQKDTFMYSVESYNDIYKIDVKLTNKFHYNYLVKDPNFEIIHVQHVTPFEDRIIVSPTVGLEKWKIYTFTIVATCDEYPLKQITSNPFCVYTYKSVLNAPMDKKVFIQILPKNHDQMVKILNTIKWTFLETDDSMLTRKFKTYLIRKNKIHFIKIQFNEKVLNFFIFLYNPNVSCYRLPQEVIDQYT